VEPLPRIRADGLRAEADHIPLLDKKPHHIGVRPGRVLPGLIEILVRRRISPLGPISAHQDPVPRRDASMPAFPAAHEIDAEKEVRIRTGLA